MDEFVPVKGSEKPGYAGHKVETWSDVNGWSSGALPHPDFWKTRSRQIQDGNPYAFAGECRIIDPTPDGVLF